MSVYKLFTPGLNLNFIRLICVILTLYLFLFLMRVIMQYAGLVMIFQINMPSKIMQIYPNIFTYLQTIINNSYYMKRS